jgi:hypothetical protein
MVVSGRPFSTDEYRSYLSGLQKSPQFHLKLESAKKLAAVDELLESGFLVDSAELSQMGGRPE